MKIKFLILFGISLCCSVLVRGQQLDTLLVEEAAYIEFLKEQGIVPNVQIGQVPMLEKLYKSYRNIKWREALRKKISGPKVQLAANTYFFGGDTTYLQRLNAPFYSNIAVSSNVKIGNIPIGLRGNAILVNGKLDRKLSTIGIEFNAQQYLQNIKDQYSDLTAMGDLFDVSKNPLQLPDLDVDALKREAQYTLYQQILANPKYRLYKHQLQEKLDSLQVQLRDTLLQDSSLYHNALEQWEKVQGVEGRYRELWEAKKKFPYEKVKEIQAKVDELQTQLEATADVTKLKNKLLDEPKTKALERFWLLTKHLNIGLFSLDEDDLTVRYLTLNGLRYGYEGKRFFGEVAYGNQSLTSSFLPSIEALVLNRYYGRRVFFAKAGIQAAENTENQMQFSFLRVDETDNPEDTLFTFPKRNTVIGWSGQTTLAKNLFLKASTALSDTDIGNGVDQDNDARLNEDKLAFTLESVYESAKNWSIGVGYFYNGASYMSLGNPYLLTNKQGLSLQTRLDLFQDKLRLNFNAKFGTNIKEDAFTKFDEFQFLGEATYRVGNQSTISASFMPNVFSQIGKNGNVRARNNIYTIQGNFFSTLKKAQLLTIVQLTNLHTDFQVVDTVQVNDVSYLYLQEMLLLSDERSLSMTAMLGMEKFQSINNSLAQLEYRFPIKKLSISLGAQVLQQQFTKTWQYGALSRINYRFWENNSFGINFNYRNNIKQKEPTNGAHFFGNASLLLSI